MKRNLLFIQLLGILMIFNATVSYAQFNIKDKMKEKSTNRAEERIDQGIDNGLDKIEDGVGKLFKKKAKANQKENESEEDQNKDEVAVQPEENLQSTKPSLQSFTKYDFVPGDKILYFEDFSQDAVGDFPAMWSTDGGGEVKTINIAPGNWFHMNREGSFYCYNKTIDFPQNFILEFDCIPDENFQSAFELCFYEGESGEEMNTELYPGKNGIQVFMDEETWYSKGYKNSDETDSPWLEAKSSLNPAEVNQVNHVIIWIQNRRLRIYHKGAKVLDSPTNIYAGAKFNKIRFNSYNSACKPYVTNLKVTTAAPDTRSKLITEGKLVSYGIYFDVNKDIVKPESYGTLNDIAKTLKENPAVNIQIVGHTDSDGNDAQNLDLSKRRAASVKNVLSGEFGIDAGRIQTDGKGETAPVAPNNSTEDKARNRRVEFVKI